MPSSVYQIVSDPNFLKLSASDQQAVLGHFDPGFSKLSGSEFGQVVSHFQKQAMARPDLVAPPSGAANSQPAMQTSALGSLYSNMMEGPSNNGQPMLSPKAQMAKNMDQDLQGSKSADAVSSALVGGAKMAGTIGYNTADLANTANQKIAQNVVAPVAGMLAGPEAEKSVNDYIVPMGPKPTELDPQGLAEKVGY